MVGISGQMRRQLNLVDDKYGNEVVVFGGWENWEEYYDRYLDLYFVDKDYKRVYLFPEYQWNWKQNYPDLVVEDIVSIRRMLVAMDEDVARSYVYADLLYRGINKWLFVRYLLVRYKKMVADWRNKAYEEFVGFKKMYDAAWPERHKMYADDWGKINYRMGYWEGYYDAMRKVRADLKTLCNTPRFVVWNGSRPGFVVDRNIKKGWLDLISKLYNVRFEK